MPDNGLPARFTVHVVDVPDAGEYFRQSCSGEAVTSLGFPQ